MLPILCRYISYVSGYVSCKLTVVIAITCALLLQYVHMTVDLRGDPLPNIIISQWIDTSLVDAFQMHLTCMIMIEINSTRFAYMSWSGVGLQQSLWVNQLPFTRQYHYVERKLAFSPWLSSHAGEYTCNFMMEYNDGFIVAVKKSFTVDDKEILHNYTYILVCINWICNTWKYMYVQ